MVVTGAVLTDRGLLDSGDTFVAAAILSLAAALLTGRWSALGLPPALVAFAFVGIQADWWGGGLSDSWERVFVELTVLAVLVGAAGIALHRAARAIAARRQSTLRWWWRAAVAGATLVAIAGSWYLSTRPPDVSVLQAPSKLYYLGNSFEGYRLTHAEAGGGRALFAYGDCESPVGYVDGGCTVPLQLQERFTPGAGSPPCPPGPGQARRSRDDAAALLVVAGSTMIQIYAHDIPRARRAARALRPVAGACS